MSENTLSATLVDHIVGLQHVGHVVEDLNVAVASFCRLYGVSQENVRYEPAKELVSDDIPTRFAFVVVAGVEFELIEPVSVLMKDKLLGMPSGLAGINHVAWRVKDIDGCVELLAQKGVKPGHVTPDGVVRFGKKSILYLDPATTGGLVVELIEITG